MPKRSLRKISVHLLHILRDTWDVVMRDAGWRVKSAHGMRFIKTKDETDKYNCIESSSEGYKSETQRRASKSSRCSSHSTESLLVFADYDCRQLQQIQSRFLQDRINQPTFPIIRKFSRIKRQVDHFSNDW